MFESDFAIVAVLLVPLVAFFTQRRVKDSSNVFFSRLLVSVFASVTFGAAFRFSLNFFSASEILRQTAFQVMKFFFLLNTTLAFFYVASLLNPMLMVRKVFISAVFTFAGILAMLSCFCIPILSSVDGSETEAWIAVSANVLTAAEYAMSLMFFAIASFYLAKGFRFVEKAALTVVAMFLLASFGVSTAFFAFLSLGEVLQVPSAQIFDEIVLHRSPCIFAIFTVAAYALVQNPRFMSDDVSGLFNGAAFSKFCRNEYLLRRRFNCLVLNIEKFSRVNQIYGRENADKILRAFSKRLADFAGRRRVFRVSDTDFLVWCESEELLDWFSQHVCDDISKNYAMGEFSVVLAYSICALRRLKLDELYFSFNDFLRYSLRFAKNSERSGVFELSEDDVENYCKKARFGAELQSIIDEDRIEMFFQPIYSVATGRFEAAEALVRFPRHDGTMFPVGPMIEAAEDNMLIVPLGDLIRSKTCAFLNKNALALENVDFFDINLSAAELLEKNIVEKIAADVKNSRVNPRKLRMEITETTASVLDKSLVDLMGALNEVGIGYLMDDFGTGYANFDFIATLNFEMIKIDRSMLVAAVKDEKNRVVLDGMVKIVHGMGAKVVVEGAETKSDVEMLKAMNVDFIQGFYFSKPLSGTDYLEFIARQEN